MFFVARWNSLSCAVAGNSFRRANSSYIEYRFKLAGLFLFLLPLIIILGAIDTVTNGRTQDWPITDK